MSRERGPISPSPTEAVVVGWAKTKRKPPPIATAAGSGALAVDVCLRSRGEKVERSFAHCYETGGMRRLHLRGRDNGWKRLLLHDAGFKLSLAMRKLYSVGKPRVLQGLSGLLLALLRLCRALQKARYRHLGRSAVLFRPFWRKSLRTGKHGYVSMRAA